MNINNYQITDDELADNPTSRVPICVLLDVSLSMQGDPINELNAGVRMFIDEIISDDMTRYSADIAILTFGGIVEQVFEFGSIEEQQIPEFRARSTTPMAAAVLEAITLLENRKNAYKSNGVDYFQPWIVLMTDGTPTDELSVINEATSKTQELINNKKLTMFTIGIGDDVDMDFLEQFGASPTKLQGLKFNEFFQWLSQSVSTISDSMPGDKINLPPREGWDSLY
jgi:uncharacterized protein YegL